MLPYIFHTLSIPLCNASLAFLNLMQVSLPENQSSQDSSQFISKGDIEMPDRCPFHFDQAPSTLPYPFQSPSSIAAV
ncbi:hypothetical protein B0T09DRAFT_81401 [Sordaria sp. MPI-SDFR-AT-0083]|nr:hypothetical protein B0T09DRAFT_81401 [Sordaria sp. MPI-SDFR-AT-0083]